MDPEIGGVIAGVVAGVLILLVVGFHPAILFVAAGVGFAVYGALRSSQKSN